MSAAPASAVARVLLVDDHPLVRAAVRQAISGQDLDVVGEAGEYTTALELTDSLRPDLILLDLDLPGRSGLEFLREVRAREPDARVVVLTVSASDRDLVDAIALGAAGYVTKDVTAEALRESVRSALRGELPLPGHLAAAAISELARGGEGTPAPRLDRLTVREREVLRLIADGATDRVAAARLAISVRTVEAHVGNILRKLGAGSRADAARMYRRAADEGG
jgi:two-component system nitrate/nitrite response regulator NarL